MANVKNEKEFFMMILENWHFLLAPIVLIVVSFAFFQNNAWMIALFSIFLLIVFIENEKDPIILLYYGVLMILVTGILVFFAKEFADWAGTEGFWLLAVGTIGMACELFLSIEKNK
ncbi:MAG: hypothetical protein NTY68_01745 [Candidatus Micrarchaeota archaeon]|nr:hypothetical protein [Candidatus Micrarchaeota archaeon]